MITCVRTTKTFSLGVEDCYDDNWAYRNGKWRKCIPKYKDTKWYEDYYYGTASTTDMLECWLQYLPGVREWDDYGDVQIEFDIGEVEEAGWTEQQLKDILGDMVTAVRVVRSHHAEEPYMYETTDAYGGPLRYYRHPALESLAGMIEKDYPRDLTPTG